MDRQDHWADPFIDAVGAGAAGLGAAGSAWLVAAALGYPALVWAGVAGVVGVLAGMMAMRAVSSQQKIILPFEPVALELPEEVDVLLLEDVLVEAEATSRVVQLFAPDSMTTPGQLQARIERHLARGEDTDWDSAATQRDEAATALHAALSDIRRTLRRT